MADIPVATVLTREVPKLTETDGLPTANSRVDIFQSTYVVVPALQDAADVARPTPTFTPVSKRRRPWLMAVVFVLVTGAAAALGWLLA